MGGTLKDCIKRNHDAGGAWFVGVCVRKLRIRDLEASEYGSVSGDNCVYDLLLLGQILSNIVRLCGKVLAFWCFLGSSCRVTSNAGHVRLSRLLVQIRLLALSS